MDRKDKGLLEAALPGQFQKQRKHVWQNIHIKQLKFLLASDIIKTS